MGSSVGYMDSTAYAAAVAAQIEKEFKLAGETVASLSRKTGIPRVTLDRRLTSKGVSPFTIREVKDIANALGTTAAKLSTVYQERVAA